MWIDLMLKTDEAKAEAKKGADSISRSFDMKVIELKFSTLLKNAGQGPPGENSLAGLDLLLNYWWPSSRAKHLHDAAKVIMCSRSQSKTKAVISEVADTHLDNIVKYVEGQSSSMVDILVHYQNINMLHSKVAYKLLQVEAQYLESFKKNRFMGVGMGKAKREVYTREAAKLYLRAGNVESYCEIMCDLNEWDKALAVAPIVGQAYWKDLMKRKAQMCKAKHKENEGDAFKNTAASVEESEAYLIAGQEIDALVDMYRGLKDEDSAFLIASVASEGGYHSSKEMKSGERRPSTGSVGQSSPESNDVLFQPLRRKSLAPLTRPPGALVDNPQPPASPGILGTAKSHSKNLNPVNTSFRNTIFDIQTARGKKFRLDGDPITAASCKLSVNDVHGAVNALIMGCEFDLAAILGYYLLDREDPMTMSAFKCQIARLEVLGQYDLCASLFQIFGYQGSDEQVLHKLRRQLLQKPQPNMNGNSDLGDSPREGIGGEMIDLLRKKKFEECVVKFVNHVEKTFEKPSWSMEDDIDVLWKYVNCINCEHVELNLKKKFLCFVFMISCMKFMWMNQDWLCAHAYNVALELLELPHITIPKAFEIAFKLQVLTFLCQSSVGSVRLYGRQQLKKINIKDLDRDFESMVLKSVEEYAKGEYIPLPDTPTHAIIPSGSKLPSIEREQKSLMKTVIRSSQSVTLEDNISCISYGEAIAWLSVCAFSPLATGAILKLARVE